MVAVPAANNTPTTATAAIFALVQAISFNAPFAKARVEPPTTAPLANARVEMEWASAVGAA